MFNMFNFHSFFMSSRPVVGGDPRQEPGSSHLGQPSLGLRKAMLGEPVEDGLEIEQLPAVELNEHE